MVDKSAQNNAEDAAAEKAVADKASSDAKVAAEMHQRHALLTRRPLQIWQLQINAQRRWPGRRASG